MLKLVVNRLITFSVHHMEQNVLICLLSLFLCRLLLSQSRFGSYSFRNNCRRFDGWEDALLVRLLAYLPISLANGLNKSFESLLLLSQLLLHIFEDLILFDIMLGVFEVFRLLNDLDFFFKDPIRLVLDLNIDQQFDCDDHMLTRVKKNEDEDHLVW